MTPPVPEKEDDNPPKTEKKKTTEEQIKRMLEAAQDPSVDVQAARLREWAASGALLLDLRPASEFHTTRLKGSVNIPSHNLDGRLHELPPRSREMAIILCPPPPPSTGSDGGGGGGGDGGDGSSSDGSKHPKHPSYEEQAATFAADFKGLPWNVWGYFAPTASLFTEAAPACAGSGGIAVESGVVHPRDRGRLWEPSDMVGGGTSRESRWPTACESAWFRQPLWL